MAKETAARNTETVLHPSLKGLERKKVNVEVREMEEGDEYVQIRLIGTTTQDWTDKQTGEVKPLTALIFEDLLNDGARFKLFQDAGLKQVMKDGLITDGTVIDLVKLAKKEIANKRTVNQYDVFVYTAPKASQPGLREVNPSAS